MKKNICLSAALIAGSICFAQNGKLTINGTVLDSTLNGKHVYVTDFGQNKLVDSCKVEDLKFNFTTDADKFISLLLLGNRAYAIIVSEEGNVDVKLGRPSEISGASMNNALSDFNNNISKFQEEFSEIYKGLKEQNASSEQINAEYEKFSKKANSLANDVLKANIGNNLGLIILSNIASDMSLEELKNQVAAFGSKADIYTPVQKVITAKENLEKTKAGIMFTDFAALNPDGSAAKLSDYVGKGKYVLVDFWASWCGPCRAAVPNIKELYEQYKDKGLVVLGVNVWDKKDAFEKAVKDLDMPWAQICGFGDNTPTDTYGIDGIPYIILFAPDGTIVERNLHGDNMKTKIAEIYK